MLLRSLDKVHRICSLLTCLISLIFIAFFYTAYFDAGFIAEYREAATLTTAVALTKGINPYYAENVFTYGNVYTILWPWLISSVGSIFDFKLAGELRYLMYIVNALAVFITSLLIIYVAKLRGLDLLASVLLGFSFFLVNSTKTTMGCFSYAIGVSLSMLAIIIISSASTRTSCFFALMLVTIASMFKIYFSLYAAPIIMIALTFLDVASVSFIVLTWIIFSAIIYCLTIMQFPLYFSSVYLLHKMFQTWSGFQIWFNLKWFVYHFAFLFCLPFVGGYALDPRRIMFILSATIISFYVIIIMLAHTGNNGAYLMHMIAPLLISYPLFQNSLPRIREGEREAAIAKQAGVLAFLLLGFNLISSPNLKEKPIDRLRGYGILSFDLESNKQTLNETERVIKSESNKSMYVDPVISTQALTNGLKYIDNGNKEYIVDYFKSSPEKRRHSIFSFLAGPTPTIIDANPMDFKKEADVVLCTYKCPSSETHKFARSLGRLRTASHQLFDVSLYYKNNDGKPPKE